MTTPDTETETDELAYVLIDALPEILTDHEDLLSHIAEPLAAIRRQAAADALLEQARADESLGAFLRKQQNALASKGDERSAERYALHSDACYRSGTRLRRAATDRLAEGYEFECAAFSQECDQRVPEGGDFCDRHQPEDDEDRWSE